MARAELRRRTRWICAAGLLLSLSLCLLPPVRAGLTVLINRLFDLSEAVNAYAYRRFDAPVEQNTLPARLALSLFLLSLGGLVMAWEGRLPALLCALALAAGQAWLGLSLPPWAQISAFACLGLKATTAPLTLRRSLAFAGAALILAAMVCRLFPGVDPRIEAASEVARDFLAPRTEQAGGLQREEEGIMETRRVNVRALEEGEDASGEGREYRLEEVQRVEVSRPRWIDYLRILLLLILSAAVVILPFTPFLLINARKRRAQALRAPFSSPDAGVAICAMFRHAAALLTSAGYGGGNRPYRDWTPGRALPEEYAEMYALCAELFEEAAYSEHPFSGEERDSMARFLEETERLTYGQADWKAKFRMKYVECLCE